MTDPKPSVHEAWAAVMAAIRAVDKGGYNQKQNFAFRGIEQIMNAVGPVFRDHGVFVVPTVQSMETERYQTTGKNTIMQGVIVTVQFCVYGPNGDYFEGSAYGQASDAGDKAVSKAMSVALRTFLTQSLMIPTNDPDPDAVSHERSAAPAGQDARVEAAPQTPLDQAKAIVWNDTLRHISAHPDSAEGDAQRWKVLDSALTEAGATRENATLDQLRKVHEILTSGELPSQNEQTR